MVWLANNLDYCLIGLKWYIAFCVVCVWFDDLTKSWGGGKCWAGLRLLLSGLLPFFLILPIVCKSKYNLVIDDFNVN